jgi:hypothetical protein
MLSPAEMLGEVAIGNDAGWALSFHHEDATGRVSDDDTLTISRDDYYASIEAALPEGFGAGKYTFRIEGLTDAHYAKLRDDAKPYSVVRLYLFWRDANASVRGYLANLSGLSFAGPSPKALEPALVAELSVTKVSRVVGARRYEGVVEARERAFMKLRRTVIGEMGAATTLELVEKLAGDFLVQVPVEPRRGMAAAPYGFNPDGSLPPPPGEEPGTDARSVDKGTYAQAIVELGKAMEESMTDARGRGVLLIRKGTLIVGKRPVPAKDRPPRVLTHATGFVDSERVADAKDPTAEGDVAAGRAQYKLTLKGRPDILPGDLVRFRPAVEDVTLEPSGGFRAAAASFLGPLLADESTGKEVTLYVNSVEHRLARDSGFATALVGVEVPGKELNDAWDVVDPNAPEQAKEGTGNAGGTANAALNAARAVRTIAEDAAAGARLPEVAEVRAMNSSEPAGDETEPAAQTVRVWRGLEHGDGRPHQARRLPIRRREPSPFEGVPYLSPFAWGGCGLVLPRYPGTRTLLVNRNGKPNDLVEVGALWESGHAPESEPGDWWLILPVGVAPAARASIPDSEEPPPEHTGAATNDLIDADGNRTIEVGEFTVRVRQPDKLGGPGSRPDPPAVRGAVTIEHAENGARITIKPDGTITIEAAADLELKAPKGDIKLDAVGVKVKVATAMEVS